MEDPIPVLPRQDAGAADIKSLVALGREEPPPIPSIDPFLAPDWPPDDEPA